MILLLLLAVAAAAVAFVAVVDGAATAMTMTGAPTFQQTAQTCVQGSCELVLGRVYVKNFKNIPHLSNTETAATERKP